MFNIRARRATRAPEPVQIPKATWASEIVYLDDEDMCDASPIDDNASIISEEAGFTHWQTSIETSLAHLLKLLRLRSIGCGNLQISRTLKAPLDCNLGYRDEAREVLVYARFPSTTDKRISTLIHDRDGRRFVRQSQHTSSIEFVNDEQWYRATHAAFLDVLHVLAQEGVTMDVCTFFEHFQMSYRYRVEHLDQIEKMLSNDLDIDVWFGSKPIC